MAKSDIHFCERNFFQETEKKVAFVMKIKFIMFGILGLAPFQLKVNHMNVKNRDISQKPTLRFVGSYICASYNLGLIIFLICLNIVYVPHMLSESPEDNSLLSKVLEIGLMLSGNSGLIVLYFNYVMRYRTMINIANNLINIDITPRKLQNHHQLLSGKYYLTVAFSLNWVFCIALILSEIFSNEIFLTALFLYLLHSIVFSFNILQYAIVLALIKTHFSEINNEFMKLSESPCKFHCDNCHLPKYNLTRMMVVEIVALKRAHAILCDICAQVADFFSFSTLFIVTYFTASIIYSVYYFIMPLIRPEAFQTTPAKCINTLVWLLMEIFPISFLATNATNVTIEMKKTSYIIDRILDRFILNPEIKAELEHCTLELLHNDFEFTAYNVIAVDNTILRSIFSAVITYLIIFIQFQLSGIRRMNE